MITEANTNNTGLSKVAIKCSAATFLVNQSLVLRINICCENRYLRQAQTVSSNLIQHSNRR